MYVGNSPLAAAARTLEGSGTGDGTTTSFPMGFTPAAEQEVFVFIDGVKQDTDAYSLSTSSCVFTAAPMTDENIDFIGFEVGQATVPQDNSVDASKMASGELPFSKSFVSAEQTITHGGSLTIAHGLGAVPSLIQFRLVCKIAQRGYSIGDEVLLSNDAQSATANYGMGVNVDATNVEIKIGASGFLVIDKSTGGTSSTLAANFNLVMRAWV